MTINIADELLNTSATVECAPINPDNSLQKAKLAQNISNDLEGCRKAHEQIEKGEGRAYSRFIKIAEVKDDRNRLSTAVQCRGPFGLGIDLSGCFTVNDAIVKKEK